jgi:hypothetical protein
MPTITPKHKVIKSYYKELQVFKRTNQTQEGTVMQAFQHVLETYAKFYNWVLTQEQTLSSIRLDGMCLDINFKV